MATDGEVVHYFRHRRAGSVAAATVAGFSPTAGGFAMQVIGVVQGVDTRTGAKDGNAWRIDTVTVVNGDTYTRENVQLGRGMRVPSGGEHVRYLVEVESSRFGPRITATEELPAEAGKPVAAVDRLAAVAARG